MQLRAILVVSASFCFWSLLEFALGYWHDHEVLKTQHGSQQLASHASKSGLNWKGQLLWIPFNVSNHKYSPKCDPFNKTFDINYSPEGNAEQSWVLDSDVAFWRLFIIGLEFLYAYNAVPELPVPLINKWQLSGASEALVGGLTKLGGHRDPDLSIAGPALIDVLLPPRANPISQKYLQAKLRQPNRILGIPMPWSTRTQFLVAIGQAFQGVLSAFVNDIIAPFKITTMNKELTNLSNTLSHHWYLAFRISVWLPYWLVLVRLLIIYVTIGNLIGSKENLWELWTGDQQPAQLIDWKSYPWGDTGAKWFLFLVKGFRKLIVPLVMIGVCLVSWRACLGLLCTAGLALLFWMIMEWALSHDRCPSFSTVFESEHKPMIMAVWSILVGSGLAKIAQSQLERPGIEMCRFSRMVLIPYFNVSEKEELFYDLFNSTSVLFLVYVIILTLLLLGICGICLKLYTQVSLRAKCLPPNRITEDGSGLIHAIWLIRSYNEYRTEEEKKSLRRSMLCAIGIFIDKKREKCAVASIFKTAMNAAEEAKRVLEEALSVAQRAVEAYKSDDQGEASSLFLELKREKQKAADAAEEAKKAWKKSWDDFEKADDKPVFRKEIAKWQTDTFPNNEDIISIHEEAARLACDPPKKNSEDIKKQLEDLKPKVETVVKTTKDVAGRVDNVAKEIKTEAASVLSKILVLVPDEQTLRGDIADFDIDDLSANKHICLGALSWSLFKGRESLAEEISCDEADRKFLKDVKALRDNAESEAQSSMGRLHIMSPSR